MHGRDKRLGGKRKGGKNPTNPASSTNRFQLNGVQAAQIKMLLFSKGLNLEYEGQEGRGTGGWLFTAEQVTSPEPRHHELALSPPTAGAAPGAEAPPAPTQGPKPGSES